MEDKFLYLIQVSEENYCARTVVENVSPLALSFDKVIEQLKAKFNRFTMLIEVYVKQISYDKTRNNN